MEILKLKRKTNEIKNSLHILKSKKYHTKKVSAAEVILTEVILSRKKD